MKYLDLFSEIFQILFIGRCHLSDADSFKSVIFKNFWFGWLNLRKI